METKEPKKKQVRRSVDERIQEIEEKITFHRDAITKLDEKKRQLLAPKPPREKKTTMTAVIAEMKKAGLTPEEVIKRLKLKLTTPHA